MDPARLRVARNQAREALLAARNGEGHWSGELSSSALATATAVNALRIVQRETGTDYQKLIDDGLCWLAENANDDGGWGDTVKSFSNISTTTLCWAVFDGKGEYRGVVERAAAWLEKRAGGVAPEQLAPAIIRRYGKDRTFSVPILTHCALAGKVRWDRVLQLPFELAAFPRSWFAALRLPVVSYALPALIAIGKARHVHRPSWNPFARIIRGATRKKTLSVLENIQPTNGGFLEATPLTSFVTMSLAGSGMAGHAVVAQGVEFLKDSVREDGSWPIDTNLATWVTTLAVNALGDSVKELLSDKERGQIRDWLLGQQYREVHPYTHAAPGGWAWTDLPGGVPDADDTPGALLALKNLGGDCADAARLGVKWLLDLQNSDGGMPTFCRGWTNLPFDRSSPDLTAHAMRAWQAWREKLPDLWPRMDAAYARAAQYLANCDGEHGWAPLWFGNQHAGDEVNWTYGTARVAEALNEPAQLELPGGAMRQRAARNCLLHMQRPDGSWGGFEGGQSSIEETALAVGALAGMEDAGATKGMERGAAWLVERVEDGSWTDASPIGFYFAKLWYFEKLYPAIFTAAALGRSPAKGTVAIPEIGG
ncbi:MAG: squalene--hopene cyclase [Verrucomicrobiales bacterium]|nr:squalene--hopene cyclase [Verrucomicrobiales bacterium]